jgi:hypothetical protein
MKYNIDTTTQSYDTTELQKALTDAGIVSSISGHGESKFTVHNSDESDEAAIDIVVQAHFLTDWKFEAAKETKRNEIRLNFNVDSMLPVTVNIDSVDYIFNGSLNSSLRVDGAYRMAVRLSEADVIITDIDNIGYVFSTTNADTIAQQIAIAFRTQFLKKQGKMVDIDAAVDQAALDLITW